MYAFLFDKKSLAMLAAAALVLVVLIFGSGFLLGVQWGLPTAADEMAARQMPATSAVPAASPEPVSTEPAGTEPLGTEPAGTEPLVTEPMAIEPASPPAKMSFPASAPPIAAQVPLSEPAAPAAGAPAPIAPSAPVATAPAAAPSAAETSNAEPAEPAAPAPAPSSTPRPAIAPIQVAAAVMTPGEPAFSLQVGAFAHRENCDAAVAALASHGYEPYVVDLQGRSRVLHTVRIGRYEDREAAAEALAQFRHKERQPAVILPPGE